MSNYINVQTVEASLRRALTEKREAQPENYRVLSLVAYDAFRRNFPALTAGLFNKIIGDMKRIGVVGTTKNGEIFLSDSAWASRQSLCLDKNAHRGGGYAECVLPKGHKDGHQDDQGCMWGTEEKS